MINIGGGTRGGVAAASVPERRHSMAWPRPRSVAAVGHGGCGSGAVAALVGGVLVEDGFGGGGAEAGCPGVVQGEQGVEGADAAGGFDLDIGGDRGAHELDVG